MLPRFHLARLAPKQSPEREERLLSYASKENGRQYIDGMGGTEGRSESQTTSDVERHIAEVTNATRQKLSFLNDLAGVKFSGDPKEDNTVINEFFGKHQGFIEGFYERSGETFGYGNWSKETVSELHGEFAKEVDEIMRRNREKMGPESCVYLKHETFVRQFMMAQGEADTSDEAVTAYMSSGHYIPNAFYDVKRQKMVFDLSSDEFSYEKRLEKMRAENPEVSEVTVLEVVDSHRRRAVVHELAHYSLDHINRHETVSLGERMITRMKQLLGVKELWEVPGWMDVKRAVLKDFHADGTGWKDVDVLHEALAILVAANQVPLKANDPAAPVVSATKRLLDAIGDDEHMQTLLQTLNDDLAYMIAGDGTFPPAYEDAMRKFDMTAQEKDDNKIFAEGCRKHNVTREEEDRVRTLNPGITDEIGEEYESKAVSLASADEILKAIEETKKSVAKIQELKTDYFSAIPAGEAKEEAVALDQILERFGQDLNDMSSVQPDADTLKKWQEPGAVAADEKNRVAQKYGFANFGTYSKGMSPEEIKALDEANARERSRTVEEIAAMIATHFMPITELAKTMEKGSSKALEAEERAREADQFKMSPWQKLARFFGKQNGIQWLSIYDMVKIYNIYKDAVVERYQSKQKIRTYDAAKEWNVWSPLQPDLDKQAKSANDEETEKFKEYLKKDGFTYNQLFDEGGVLDMNRGNINRAKAVIDYAADHAWLYKLDRTNGHDVYGVDYLGLWGTRTFEELVEHNAEQQDKESSGGYSKVNNHPEIYLIVEDMIEELERKNLWQVHGMMKRLQEKAKLAESNTWAVTTLFRAMRQDPDVLKIMDIGMLDKIGGIGITQSAWSMTLYKTQRKKILAMKHHVAQSGNNPNATEAFIRDPNNDFIMGQVIAEIESKLPANLRKGKPPKRADSKYRDFTDLDHEVAKVLAGQTVTGAGGKPVSIFDPGNAIFKKYRDYFMDTTNTTPTEPGSTDPDFYNPQNGGADLLLLGAAEIANNFSHTSQGRWTEENKAINFATQVLMRDVELGRRDKRIQQNFRQEMRKKFAPYFDTNVLGQAAAINTVPKYKTGAQTGMPREIHNVIILDEFMSRGMIDVKVYRTIKKEEKNPTTPAIGNTPSAASSALQGSAVPPVLPTPNPPGGA